MRILRGCILRASGRVNGNLTTRVRNDILRRNYN